jgi:hypothetical protein
MQRQTLKTARRRLSVSRMRKNLMSGSMWQGMETRHGDGTEALSQETGSNRSATPKSRRHSLTLPPDGGILRAYGKHFSGFEFFLLPSRVNIPPQHR